MRPYHVPHRAMVLAAGLGLRMRPLTDSIPKPLISVAGKPLIDWSLDCLAAAGVEDAVVNIHHLADQIVRHLGRRAFPRTQVSDERGLLLESGGGIVKALPRLGTKPFYVLNADTFWIDESEPNLVRMARSWDPSRMDMLLLLADPALATGHSGGTDFLIASDGSLRRSNRDPRGLIYAGAAIVSPGIFRSPPEGPHSLNVYFDRAIAAGRLHGLKLTGTWITVGTPDAIARAEAAVGGVEVPG